jgi:hypothetical protein
MSLDADSADLHGSLKVEQRGGRSNIGFWDNSADCATWNVDFTKAGAYKVTAHCALPQGETQIAVEVAGTTLTAKAATTGDWDRYANVELGTVEIAKAGVQEVKVRPGDANDWKAVNLRDVTFTRKK